MIAAAAGTVAMARTGNSASKGKIRVGQIGTKHAHASGKMSTLRKLDDVFEVVGVVEDDEQQRAKVQQQPPYQGLKWMTAEQLLETQGLQAVAIETRVQDLVANAMLAVDAGMHIHLDKPAGPSMRACRALHAAAEKRGVTIQMGYMLRYNPAFQFLFQIVREGWLGTITELSTMMGKQGSESLRRDLAEFSGGGMFELSCHVIDAMVTVLGKPTRVQAFTHRTYPDRDSFADNQLAVCEYETALATVRCNHLDPFGFPRRHFNVVGELGTLQINPLEPPQVRLALDRPRGKFRKGFQDVALKAPAGRYDEEFLDFARVIRQEKALAWNSQHDLDVHATVLLASGMPLD